MKARLEFSAVDGLLEQGAVLVTANNRLARHLTRHYGEMRASRGGGVWETPDILPLGAWLGRTFERLADDGWTQDQLLGPHEQRLMWERQVNASAAGSALLRPDAAAVLAAEAWERLCAWNLGLDDVDPGAGEEARAFRAWADGYIRECADRGRLEPARLPGLIARAAEASRLPLPAAFIFAGFEELTPAIETLAETLEAAGCPVHELEPPALAHQASRIGFQDKESEIRAAASWAAHRLAADPAARIAILIPDLAQRRAEVVRTFDALLHPASCLSSREPVQRAYNLSLGSPLVEGPLTSDALLALRLLIRGLEIADVSRLLRSPFLGDARAEFLPRCRLEAWMREWPDQRISATRLYAVAVDRCPALAERLKQAAIALDGGTAPPDAWANRFRDALSALGWPAERSRDSTEQQWVQRFRDLVDEFPALGRVEPRMDSRRALDCLAAMARDTTFQPESAGTEPIQVMGMLEADGQTFDGLWIAGLSDQQFPPTAEPHPLLPVVLQRRHAMPRASAERELAFARRLLDRLTGASPEVILSWPRRDEDRELLPSPLILGVAERPFEALAIEYLRRPEELWLGASPLTAVADNHGVPLPPDSAVGGGTRLLVDQAACPFRAYARHRLHAEGLADPEPGPSPLVRGTLLHTALEVFWNAVGSHVALLALDDEHLKRHIDDAVVRALDEEGRDLAGRGRDLEQERLARRLAAWLDIERRRAPFRVAATEERREVAIGGLRLRTSADRVDRLEDGRSVVIDYKSGNAKRDGWFEGRLFEPQLPLYAVQVPDSPVAAVCFAKLKPGDTRFIGAAEDSDLVPGVQALKKDRQCRSIADWPDLVRHWQEQLEILATEVREGIANVAPQKSDACTWCDLGDLCRYPFANEEQDDAGRSDG